MHGHAGRLVDGDELVVFQQHRKFPRWCGAFGLLGDFFGNPHGRHAHQIPCFDSGIGARAALVHAHFSTADDAVNQCFRNAFELAYQKVVQALTGIFRIDFNDAYCRCGYWGGLFCRFALYNVFHLRDECVSG